jgi:hypothetical protein
VRKTVATILYEVKDSLELMNKEAYGERSLDPMVSETYLIQKVNDSLEEIQGYINKQYEDYFLTYNTYQMNEDQSQQTEYDLPSNIFMNKIRRVMYHYGSNPLNTNTTTYPMGRLQNINDAHKFSGGEEYRYMLIDRPVTGDVVDYKTKLVTFPYGANNNDYFTIWYIRELATVSATGDTVELPNVAMRYLVEDVKSKCLEKDIGNPMAGIIEGNKQRILGLMQTSIANKVPDDQSGYLQKDTSHYDDSILNDMDDIF